MSSDRYRDRGEKMKILVTVLIVSVLILAVLVGLVVARGGPATFKCLLGRVYSIQEYREAIQYDLKVMTPYDLKVMTPNEYGLMGDEDQVRSAVTDLMMMGFEKEQAESLSFVESICNMDTDHLGAWMREKSL